MYYKIYDWMLDELHLSGTDLLVYAVIYHFTFDSEYNYGCYGGYPLLRKLTGASDTTLWRICNTLVEMRLITKKSYHKEGKQYNIFFANSTTFQNER